MELIEVYQFAELSKEAQERAISSIGGKVSGRYLSDYTFYEVENAESKLGLLFGFEGAKVLFSGFGSQGDGACFTATGINFETLINVQFPKYKRLIPFYVAGVLTGEISHNFRYYHERSTRIDFEIHYSVNYPNVENLLSAFERDFKVWYYSFCKDIYKALEAEHDNIFAVEFQKELIENDDSLSFYITGEECNYSFA